MAATIPEVARLANVGQTTVSLAFREGSRISEATRRRVLDAARRLNYVPNLAARRLRQGQPRLLGLLINDITNPFYALMARRMELTAGRAGYEVMISESEWDAEREVASMQKMLEARVRGMLVCLCEKSDEGLKLLERFGMPHVLLDTYPVGFRGAYVANDLPCAGRLAAEHLVKAGCRRPVLMMPNHGDGGFSSFVRMRRAFAQVVRQNRISFTGAHVIDAKLTIESGFAAFEQMRSAVPEADGVFCGNDLCALGVMEAGDRAGIRIGRDLAIMGIDDLRISSLARISLTSIRQPYVELTDKATGTLIECIDEGADVAIRKTLKPELVVRDSTRR